jgi:hypothetical protein
MADGKEEDTEVAKDEDVCCPIDKDACFPGDSLSFSRCDISASKSKPPDGTAPAVGGLDAPKLGEVVEEEDEEAEEEEEEAEEEEEEAEEEEAEEEDAAEEA